MNVVMWFVIICELQKAWSKRGWVGREKGGGGEEGGREKKDEERGREE